jgi:uncharacterized protein (DUF488 family)
MNPEPDISDPTLWTLGHFTRSREEFLALLHAHRIALLVDVRRYPGSRRYPHFQSDALKKHLADAGLGYELGGRRAARSHSLNDGWKNASFRGYADYMKTREFHRAIEVLTVEAVQARTALMYAEGIPWRCHRSLIANALVARGWIVVHILGLAQVKSHQMTAFARVEGGQIIYPAPIDEESPPRLFRAPGIDFRTTWNLPK